MAETRETIGFAGLEYYTPRDYARTFGRRKWLILVGTFAIALATAVVTYFLPNSYKATAVIVVDPQKVPDSYVNPTTTESSVDRLTGLRQQILSTTRLGKVIDDMALYTELKKKESPEEIVQDMRKDITVDPVSGGVAAHGQKMLEAFTISYKNRSPVLAAQVANALAKQFVDDNRQIRALTVEGTSEFLQKELDDTQRDMKEKEDQITLLKTKDPEEGPETEVIQVQALSTLQTELQTEQDAVARAQGQKASLQASLASGPSVIDLDSQESPAVTSLETQKAQLQDEVDQLRKRYGPSYPDVVKKNLQITDLQTRIDQARKKETAKATPAPLKQRNPVIQSEIAKADEEIQKHQTRQQEIQQQISLHQSILERIPLFQERLSALTREYEAAEDHYKRLQEQKFSANMTADMEAKQQGERFELQDSAQIPTRPDTPDRPTINLIGLGAGLLLSIVGAFALEILDPSVKTEREVVGQLGAPVFGEVPWLPSKGNIRQKRLQALFALASGAVLAAAYSFLLVVTWR
ncbi:MAG: Wzz/FepE/Etk N-terminal domain-containing protein [Candidatus Acidiferrales bacterium]